MTDNTPRPEPMSRESVLTVLDSCIKTIDKNEHISERLVKLHAARAAVAALYERCEALERAVVEKNSKLTLLGDFMRSYVPHLGKIISYTGTETSDAEGGG